MESKQCKDCGLQVPRKAIIRKKGDRRTYLDDKNRKWGDAYTCPDCIGVESFQLPIYHETKCCSKCKGKLELDRYFNCHACTPKLEEGLDDALVYMIGE